MSYDQSIDYRLVSFQEKWTFTPIWKNGTKSIFETMSAQVPDIERSPSTHQIHSFVYPPLVSEDLNMLHKDSEEYLKILKSSFNFVCIRDPYERFISAFYHKLIQNPNGLETKSFYKQYGLDNYSDIKKLYVFVEYILSNNEVDPHFWSQSKLARLDEINYSYMIKMDSLRKDWDMLSDKFTNIPKLHEYRLHATDSKIFADHLKKDKSHQRLVKKIEMLYLDDYKFIERLS